MWVVYLEKTKKRGLEVEFPVTLEATHHGPYVEVPACFVEIGSTEEGWVNQQAGDMWSSVLGDFLHLQSVDEVGATSEELDETVLRASIPIESTDIVFRTNSDNLSDILNTASSSQQARYGDGLFVGHAMTSYSLKPYLEGTVEEGQGVDGGWKTVIREAVEATRFAMPKQEMIVLIDKGAFNSEQRGLITSFLETDLKVQWTVKTADVKKLWEKTMSVAPVVVNLVEEVVVDDLPEDTPVFDDCDEVRTKIAVYIQQPGMNNSKFSKLMGVTPATVSTFLSKKGYNQGAGTVIYPRAYRFFEKLRLQSKGQPKSAHRLKSEKNYPYGYALENAGTKHWVIVPKGW
eukprot:gene32218-39785_t